MFWKESSGIETSDEVLQGSSLTSEVSIMLTNQSSISAVEDIMDSTQKVININFR